MQLFVFWRTHFGADLRGRIKMNNLNQENYYKLYYQANKERIRKYHKLYYQANKERIKERQKAYYQTNKERVKEYQEIYYYTKGYRQANKQRAKMQQKTLRTCLRCGQKFLSFGIQNRICPLCKRVNQQFDVT